MSYPERLSRIADALAAADCERVAGDLAPGLTVERLEMFVDDNLEKRFEKLRDQLAWLASGLELDEIIEEYIATEPLAAYDTGLSDGTRLMQWLPTQRRLTDEQQDLLAIQLARHELEERARAGRAEHLRFQALWRQPPLANATSPWLLHLNPVRAAATLFTPRLLDAEATLPAAVLLFPAGDDIRTAALEDEGLPWVEELAGLAPCPLASWQAVTRVGHPERLPSFADDLVELGLAAWEG